MNDTQLYLSIGIPSFVVLVGILVNAGYSVMINNRIMALETRLGSLEARLDSRIGSLEARLDSRIGSLEAKFDLLTGKVIEVDNRLTRVEEQLKHLR